MRVPTLSPSDVVNLALEINTNLEKIRATLAHWRSNGYNGSKEIPIKLIPIEVQATKTCGESKKMVEYILNLIHSDQPNRRDVE